VTNCLGERLKQARLTLGVSQKRLGILVGIDEYSAGVRMNQYETGKHRPNFSTLQRIGKVLGYPVEFFFSEDDAMAELICLAGKLSSADRNKVLNVVKKLLLNYNQNLPLIEA